MIIDGSKVLRARGTVLLTLEDGREVTMEVHPLDMDLDDLSNRGHLVTGLEYLEDKQRDFPLRDIVNPGPPHLTLNLALRSSDDALYTVTIPTRPQEDS